MDQREVWRKFILAQEKILEYRSLPIAIKPEVKNKVVINKLILKVDQEVYKQIFVNEVEKFFKIKDFKFENRFILQDVEITEKIDHNELLRLKEEAQRLYIDFNEFPIIEGLSRVSG
jgi:hypothetical protein